MAIVICEDDPHFAAKGHKIKKSLWSNNSTATRLFLRLSSIFQGG